MTIEDLKSKGVSCDTLSKRKGEFTLRKAFFYRRGSATNIAEQLKDNFPNVEILDTWENFVPFRGGDSVAKGSHYGVKFKLVD